MPKASDETVIRTVMEEWAEALRAKNADSMLRHLSSDVVVFDLAPPLLSKGPDRQGLEAWFATWQGPLEYEQADLAIAVGGDLAFVRSLDRIAGTKTDGEKSSTWVRSTICLGKRGGTWKIVHIHSSVPFYMDGSLKAAVDLLPERTPGYNGC